MAFKLVKTGKSYAEPKRPVPTTEAGIIAGNETASVPLVIWETGNVDQIGSLLVLREAELVVAKAHLTGNECIDWYTKNKILDLEIKIADLRRWLAEVMDKNNGSA